jgi:D-alanine-D-alanine ligase
VPAPLTDAQVAEVQLLACRAFTACRCEAMARVDLFLTDTGFLVNEVNTIPGFTPISMYPRLWEATGVPYAELLDRLIALALERHERRAARAGRQR